MQLGRLGGCKRTPGSGAGNLGQGEELSAETTAAPQPCGPERAAALVRTLGHLVPLFRGLREVSKLSAIWTPQIPVGLGGPGSTPATGLGSLAPVTCPWSSLKHLSS